MHRQTRKHDDLRDSRNIFGDMAVARAVALWTAPMFQLDRNQRYNKLVCETLRHTRYWDRLRHFKGAFKKFCVPLWGYMSETLPVNTAVR